ncbi:MAG: carbohydrate ABC transporter permease [Candidatus Binatia bacterium]
MRRGVLAVALQAALFGIAILTALPLWWMLAASFMATGEASGVPPRLWPSHPTLAQYHTLFARLDLARAAFNSLIVACAATAVALLLNSMAGYAFAKLRFSGRERIFRTLVATLVIPGQIAMFPLFLMLKELGLVNTYWGVIVPSMASIFGIFLVKQYAEGLPDSMLDAARVDGASEWRIYRSLVLPACRPILVTLGLFTFMGAWNDFLWPLVVLTDGDLYTLPVALANLVGEHVQDTELIMAGAVLTVIPVIVLFLALQRFYIAGILGSGLKG